MDEEVVIKGGMEALLKELGPLPVEATRFVNIPREKRVESVKRLREWQKALNKEQFFDEVFENKLGGVTIITSV